MTEYRLSYACVRIHGSTDQKKLKEATNRFLREAEEQKKKEKDNNANCTNHIPKGV